MLLNLAQSDYHKYTWISQMSLLFALHNGCLTRETNSEIELILNNVYDTEARFIVRGQDFEDVDRLYATVVTNKYDFLTEIISRVPDLQVATVVNVGAGIGVAAICLAKFLDNAVIRAFESNEADFDQLQRNLVLNAPINNRIAAYRQYGQAVNAMDELDLLVCAAKSLSQFPANEALVHLMVSTKIILVESFPSSNDQNSFIECITKLGFQHEYADMSMVCWKPKG